MAVSLFIFDLDGTLLDSIDDIAFSMNHVLKEHGFPEHPKESYFYFVGNGARVLSERALSGLGCTETETQSVLEDFMAFYDRHKSDNTRPFEGLTETLETLQAQGIRLAVASNKPHEVMEELMHRQFPTLHFSVVLGHRKGHPVKPDPEIVFDILEKIRVPREEVLYLGDTAVDVKTAHAAGLRAVGVLWGFRNRLELEEAGADRLISRPVDILSLL